MARGALFEPKYRNPSEKFLGDLLDAHEIPFSYEGREIAYEVPARTAKYLPDFPIEGTNIILEYKGVFGHRGRGGPKERQKLILLQQQHPQLDIRLVFYDARKKLYPGSKTTYAMWADVNGFKWCEINKARELKTLPASWLRDMKPKQRKRTATQ